MSKVIKRVATFCFMAVLLIAMIPQTIKADETSDAKKAVYVQVPKDWEAPCVWAWDDDGNNAFEAWPGEEMDADTTNEGWYYIWVPAWTNHVIVNANEGNVQTAEQVLEGENGMIEHLNIEKIANAVKEQLNPLYKALGVEKIK